MASLNKRRRVNRVVRILSKIYNLDYVLTQRIYNRFNQDLNSFKLEMNRLSFEPTRIKAYQY